jgi:hypothetical protein
MMLRHDHTHPNPREKEREDSSDPNLRFASNEEEGVQQCAGKAKSKQAQPKEKITSSFPRPTVVNFTRERVGSFFLSFSSFLYSSSKFCAPFHV